MSKICPNFGHIMDTFWALPCHGDIFWAMCCNCPNNGQEFRHFFGHNQPVWSYFKHILGTNWGLVTFWAHYGHLWGEMCPKCDHPHIVLQCPSSPHSPFSVAVGHCTRAGPHIHIILPYLCKSLGQGMPLYLILKLWMSPFIWGMVDWSAPRHYRVTDQNEEACMQTPGGPHCAKQ